MKKFKYIIIFILSIGLFNSCLVNDEAEIDQNDAGYNVATFERPINNLTGIADGSEYEFKLPIRIVGPTVKQLTADINVTFTATAESSAEDGVHYRIEEPTVTLTNANNYLGYLTIVIMSEGNTPPLEDDPAYEDYVIPMLYLDITTTGDATVVGSGKTGTFTINFIPPNPYAGLYDTEMRYFHPTAGGSYPPSVNPDDPYGGIRYVQKDLAPITSRQCETGFAVWWDTDLCWITVNADNTITFLVADTWPYDVSLGDPFDASHVSYFDPVSGDIILYYHYYGTGGARIFWEYFYPTF